jgi:hypothetical protein
MTKRAVVLRGLACAVTVAIGGLWAARRADAIVVIGGKPAVDTGMFGIGIGQTARVHILNITDPAVPAPPCNVEVRFFDAQGDLLGESRLSVLPGRAAFADHTDPTLRLGQRKHLRASVLQQPPDPAQPTPACVMTAEAFDNVTGRAGIIIVNGHPVP